MPQPSQIGSSSFRRRRQFRRTDGPQNPLAGTVADIEGMYKHGVAPPLVTQGPSIRPPEPVSDGGTPKLSGYSTSPLQGYRPGSIPNARVQVQSLGRQAQSSAFNQQQRVADQQRVLDQETQREFSPSSVWERNRRDGFVTARADLGPASPLSPEYMAKIRNEQANSDFRLTPGGSQMLDRFSRLGQAAQARAASEAYGPLTGQALANSQSQFEAERLRRNQVALDQGIPDPLTGTQRLRTYAEANAERLRGRNSPALVAAREQRAAEQVADRRQRTARRYGLNPLTPQGFAASDPEGYVQQQEALGRGRVARETGTAPGNPLRSGVPSGPPQSAQEAQQRAGAMVQKAATSPALQALGVIQQKPDGTSGLATVPELADSVLSNVGVSNSTFSDTDLRELQSLVKEMKNLSSDEDLFGGGFGPEILRQLSEAEDTPEAREAWRKEMIRRRKQSVWGRTSETIRGWGANAPERFDIDTSPGMPSYLIGQ